MNVDEDHEQKVVDKEIEKPLLTCWRVEDFNLRICPSHLNLEHNTHITVIGSSAPMISKIISEFARIHSIVLKYGNDINDVIIIMAAAAFLCMMELSLSLAYGQVFSMRPVWIRLLQVHVRKEAKHNNNWDTDTNSIIVEARKMPGDSLGALNLRRKLFSFFCPDNKKFHFSEAKANSSEAL